MEEIERIIRQVIRREYVYEWQMELFVRNLAALYGLLTPQEIEKLTIAGYEADLEEKP